MNTKTLLPLTAAALFAACTASMLLSARDFSNAPLASSAVSDTIVDLPTVTVRPAAEDLAWYQSHKIIDLAAVTVRPEAADLAYYQASKKIVDLAAVTVRPAAEDLAVYLASQAADIVDLPAVTVRPSAEDVETVIGVATLATQIAR